MKQRKQRTELSKEIRKNIIDKHVCNKVRVLKIISKQLNVPVTTVAHMSQWFKVHGTVTNLPRHIRKTKINDKLRRWIKRLVTKEPRTASKEINIQIASICNCLSQSRLPRRTPLLKANHKKVRLEFVLHIDMPQSSWENVLWTNETKLELFGKAHQLYDHRCKNEIYYEKKAQH